MTPRNRGSSMAEKDREFEAIRTIVAVLDPLDDHERSRVLEYVLKRLQMATLRAPATAQTAPQFPPTSSATRAVTDIRSLKEEKRPRSANEMAALVAYYLSEIAPQGERSDTVNAETLRRYFKMAAFRLPSQLRYTLGNAAAAGYLENAGRGEYRLNPVGYNLVVHGLPRNGEGSAESAASLRRTRKKKASRKRANRNPARKKKTGR